MIILGYTISNIEKWARLEEVYTIVKVYSSVKLLLAAAAENFPLLHIWVHCENDNSSWIQSFFENAILKRSLLLGNDLPRENFTPALKKLDSAKLIWIGEHKLELYRDQRGKFSI